MVANIRNEYLICYDIQDNKIRDRFFKDLRAYGLKIVQKSVFWGFITNAELSAIKNMSKNIINNDNNKILIMKTAISKNNSYFFGYDNSDFKDWDEFCFI
jgi:CRISPR-associated protein Cas2